MYQIQSRLPVLYKRWRYCGNPKFLVHVIKVFASYELVSVSLCDDSINVPVHLVLCDSMQVIHHPVVLFCRTPLILQYKSLCIESTLTHRLSIFSFSIFMSKVCRNDLLVTTVTDRCKLFRCCINSRKSFEVGSPPPLLTRCNIWQPLP